MSELSTETVIATARELFTEAYEGPAAHGSWFVSNGADSGIFSTVALLSAAQASAEARPGRRSIAAHIEHLRWSLARVNEVARGKPWQPDWSASWSIQGVNDQQWTDLRTALRHEYEQLLQVMAADQDWSDPVKLRGLLALTPHAAYHLGAIRQLARLVSPEKLT